MNRYKILLNEDVSFLKTHIIFTNLVEKGLKESDSKIYQSDLRELTLITPKDIDEKVYEKVYLNKGLKWKVVREKYIPTSFKQGERVKVSGVGILSFIPFGEKKEKALFDVRTKECLFPEQLKLFISKNMGLKDFSYKVKTYPKTELSDNKIIIYNRVFIEIEGIVENEKIINRLNLVNIGKKKSYGMGAYFVESL